MTAARAALFLAVFMAAVAPAWAAPPNIVFIYTDDHGPWALGLEHPQAHTPHLDRFFAKEGARLVNAFVTTPVCSPSRAGLFTGRYATEVEIHDWIQPGDMETGLDPDLPAWPTLLAEAGYATALMGKWHLGNTETFHPTRFGFDEFTGFLQHGPPADPVMEQDGEERRFEGLTIDLLTDELIGFIERHREGPFMAMLSARSPHRSWLPVADEDWAPYEGVEVEIPDYPGLDTERVQGLTREYLASVTSIDRNVGRILAALDDLGLVDDTVVVFTANEGNALGHHGFWGKGNAVSVLREHPPDTDNIPGDRRPNLMDTVLRVPTAVRWPGAVEGGRVIEETVSNLDWFPTLLAMAGVDLPGNAPEWGRNLTPLLKGESVEDWDNEFYAEYSPHHGVRAHMRAWRTPRWKLVRDFLNPWRDEFYDLANDPEERENLIHDGRFEARMAKQALHGRILARMAALDDPVLALTDGSGPAAAETEAVVREFDIAPAWSVHKIGRPRLLTAGEWQYVLYYDEDRYMAIAQRKLGSADWTIETFPMQMGWATAGHARLTLAVDREGHVHVSGYRRSLLDAPPSPPETIYYRTAAPHDIARFERHYMVAEDEPNPGYPAFITGPDGTLYFEYRVGGSGAGAQRWNVYDPATRTWEALPVLLDGEGAMSAYGGPRLGPDGYWHCLWMWRDTPYAETNHTLSYMRSADMETWETAAGTPVSLPVTADTPGVVVDGARPGEGLINMVFTLGWDHDAQPVVAYHRYDGEGASQIYNARFEEGAWRKAAATDWEFRWDFGGPGALPYEARTEGVQAVDNGLLRQRVWSEARGDEMILLDGASLEPVDAIEVEGEADAIEPDWRRELSEPETHFPDRPMDVHWIEDKGGSSEEGARYVLRWEVGPRNRDQPVPEPWPEPTMLRVYKIGGG